GVRGGREAAVQRVLHLEQSLARPDRGHDPRAAAIEVDEEAAATDDDRPGAGPDRPAIDLVGDPIDRDPEAPGASLIVRKRAFDADRAIAPGCGNDELALHVRLLICYPQSSVPNLVDVLLERRIIVCVGSGGVGKTTTAATLAL